MQQASRMQQVHPEAKTTSERSDPPNQITVPLADRDRAVAADADRLMDAGRVANENAAKAVHRRAVIEYGRW